MTSLRLTGRLVSVYPDSATMASIHIDKQGNAKIHTQIYMKYFPAKIPSIVKKLFPGFVWNMPRDEKILYITFDDGPIPDVTEWVLDELKKYGAKASFFCIGDNVKKHPKIFGRLLSEGHSIGNHTYNHLKGWKTDTAIYIENTLKAEEVFNEDRAYSSQKSRLFRPPYGQISIPKTRALRKSGYKIIMWDVIALDWIADTPAKKSAANIIDNATNGSVVVFHDSLKAERNMKYALTKTLEHFSSLGFEFKGLS